MTDAAVVQRSHFDAATDAVLLASRAVVGLAARSLPEWADVTLVQFRALVLLDRDGALKAGRLAELLAVMPSTVTGLCDRLVSKGLIGRATSPANRREVVVTLTASGKTLVDAAMAARREEIARILARISPELLDGMVEALSLFTDAADQDPQKPRDQ